MSVIQKKLEDGVVEIFTSEKYREYMDAMSKFPRYSVNNCILIASQYPQASLVCGFRKWQKEFNRTVNKGEHGIMILAPIKGKTEVIEEVFDENNRAVLIEISPVPITFAVINDGAKGYYSPTSQLIVVDSRLPQLQMLKTMIHEIAHASLGHGGKEDKWDRQTKEV